MVERWVVKKSCQGFDQREGTSIKGADGLHTAGAG